MLNTITRFLTNFGRRESGMAMIETALILPVLMMLLFGIVDFSRMMWTHHVANAAATEGARLASLHEPSTTEIEDYVRERLNKGGITADATIHVSSRTPGNPLTVSVDVAFALTSVSGFLLTAVNVDHISAAAYSVMEH